LRNLRFELRLMIELLNEPLSDLNGADIYVVLYGDIHLRTGGLEVPRQSGKTVQRLSNGVQPRDRNIERSFLLSLLDNLIDAGTQLKVSAAQSLFRWQKFDCRAAAGSVFLDLVGRRELETISLMSMQAREVQIVVTRHLRHRLAGGKPTVNFGTS
jgi:hypothetical protein